MGKDFVAVKKYYDEIQTSEFRMCHQLNKRMPEKLIILGYFFEIQSNSQYNKDDIVLTKILPNRVKKEIIRIEYEYGANQEFWDFEIPDETQWQAINLVTRKEYGKNFPLFIKSSKTFRSLFAIDCRDNFVIETVKGRFEKLSHSLEFETDDEFYRIYWDDVEKHKYVCDKKNKKMNDGKICLVEDDNWNLLYNFIWHRFLKTFENDKT